MKISLNTIQDMIKREGCAEDIASDGVEKLVEKIGAQLGGVDEVIDFGKKYQGIVVAKIVSCQEHPNADKLKVCLINDGGKFENVERDNNGHVQVVCGAPNAREGILVAWLPPGLTVPATVDKDPFVLEAKDFRGQMSNGMLASLKELELGDDHTGILEIDPGQAIPNREQKTENLSKTENGKSKTIQPGDDFAKAFGLDDYIIDIENKMFTHRPDLFGFLGVARELAGIQHMPFKSPEWYVQDPDFPGLDPGNKLDLEVNNEIPELVPRFTAITMSAVRVGPSPLWLQIFLAKMGQKSINNIVDYTNYFMHMTAQPLHAYDYDKLALSGKQQAVSIETRKSRKGDKLKLLNGKEITFDNEATILITSGDEPIGIGGVMGGSETEVDETTTNIVIECANFDMYSIRRTAMELGLFTDAVTRFTKGQSPLQSLAVLAKIVDEIQKYASGKVASDLIDIKSQELGVKRQEVEVSPAFINSRLGLKLSGDEIAKLLQNVEFKVSFQGGSLEILEIIVPFWRTDIEIAEDIVEEVGRLYGYDQLPLELPKRSIVPTGPDGMLRLKQTLRQTLATQGANEVLTYSFVHEDLLEKAGQNKSEAYTISNALSPDLQYYRLSLTPSLLAHVHQNSKAGYDQFALFELGKTHNKKHENEDDVPKEIDTLSLVITSSDKTNNNASGAPYYQARRYLNYVAEKVGVELVYYPAERDPDLAMTAPFDLSRSAFVTIKDSKGMLGIVGEYKQSVYKSLKLPSSTSGFEIGTRELLMHAQNRSTYKPLSRYPGTWQDVCFQVPTDTNYKDVYETVLSALSEVSLDSRVEPIDIYQPDSREYKNITLRVYLTNHKHTITADETKGAMEKITQLTHKQLNAKVI